MSLVMFQSYLASFSAFEILFTHLIQIRKKTSNTEIYCPKPAVLKRQFLSIKQCSKAAPKLSLVFISFKMIVFLGLPKHINFSLPVIH